MSNRIRRGSSQRAKNFRIDVEALEPRLLLAADIQLNDSFVIDQDPALAGAIVQDTRSQEVNLGPLQLLLGDTAIGAADGHQIEPQIAQGGNQYLSVWTDYRTSPEKHPGTITEGLGGDIYGSIMDANGDPVSETPIVINQDFGDQEKATAAWNGEHWLVAWTTPSLTQSPTYQRIVAVRVAPDGTVVDETPIEVHNDQVNLAYYDGLYPIKIASSGQDWVVAFRNTYGNAGGAYAIHVAADGSIPLATPTEIGDSPSSFGIAAAQDRYLITWQDAPGIPGRGRLYAPDLQPIGAAFSLPGAEVVASDGTDFMVTWYARGPGASYTLKGIKVNHDGTRPNPAGFAIQVMPSRPYIPQLVWDGTFYWPTWNTGSQLTATRVDPNGTVIDPGGTNLGEFGLLASTGAIGGGMQLVWSDGGGAAYYPKDVYATHISSPTQVDSNVLLSSGASAQLYADFAEGPDMFAVAFESRYSGNASIHVQRLDAHGAALDAEPIVIASGPEVHGPAVAYDGTRYLITWSDDTTIFAQRMAIDGTLLGSPIEVIPYTRERVDVAGIDGTFLVAGAFKLLDGTSYSLAAQRVDGATGALLDLPPGAPVWPYSDHPTHPNVVAFGDRFLVTWQSASTNQPTQATTNGAFFELDGTSTGPFTMGLNWRPDVAVSGDRALFVAVSQTIVSAQNDIEGRIMLADGTFLGPVFTISDAPNKQLRPAVTFDGENFLVAWQDKRDNDFHYDASTDIYGTRVSPIGEVLDFDAGGFGGVAMTSTPQPERDAALITSGGTTLFATSTFIADRDIEAYRLGIAEVAADLRGDFNGDQSVDAEDIDMLAAEIHVGSHSPPFDLTGDGFVDSLDMDELVLNILGTLYGDANLDRVVDGLDFIQWNENRFRPGGWLQGDFNGDAIVDGNDFIVWNENKFQTDTGGLVVGPSDVADVSDRSDVSDRPDVAGRSDVTAGSPQLAAWKSQSMRRLIGDTIRSPDDDGRESPLGADLAGQLTGDK